MKKDPSSSPRLDLSVIVSTYQRPLHLERCLLSLAGQRNVAGRFEVIVVDDGSLDETPSLVKRIAGEVDVPLRFLTHPHNGFQLSRCRNRGIQMASAPYLVLADGDCLFPPDHLARQLDARRPGIVRAGHSIRLDQRVSADIDSDAVRSGAWLQKIPRRARLGQLRHWFRSELEYWIGHPTRPKLVGNSIAIWRDQLEAINGFDEQFRGWGCEDDDLRLRLIQSGQRIRTNAQFGVSYHMWHPPDSTAPTQWRNGNNVNYFRRPIVLTTCLHGLRQRTIDQIRIQITIDDPIGRSDQLGSIAKRLSVMLGRGQEPPELEICFSPHRSGFRTSTARKIAILPAEQPLPNSIRRVADAIIRLPENASATFVVDEILRLAGIATSSSVSDAA